MNSPQQSNGDRQLPTDLVKDAIDTLDSIEKTVLYQVLGNADALHEGVDKESQADLKLLVESMIKKPFRRQAGRLRNVKRMLNVALERQAENTIKEGE